MQIQFSGPAFTKETAWDLVGGLSEPSKMPGWGHSTPAQECKTGRKLRKIVGTICEKCYALRGHYLYPVVRKALYRRLEALKNPLWVKAMAFLIRAVDDVGYFRISDSGDMQNPEHFTKWVEVCNLCPKTKFWIPTREYSIIADFIRAGGKIPKNLCVRLSAMSFDKPAPVSVAKRLGVQVSGASKIEEFNCPASSQGNKCMLCRACWNQKKFAITYKAH